MIIDAFIFDNELDTLELRLNELDSVVDKFVLVESDKTFTYASKPCYFQENKHQFQKFIPKIEHHIVTGFTNEDAWKNEYAQRNAIMDVLKATTSASDTVMVSDVDEIPRKELVKEYPSPHVFITNICIYYLNLFVVPEVVVDAGIKWSPYPGSWAGTYVCPFNQLTGIQEFRDKRDQFEEIWHRKDEGIYAGWHFTYQGGMERFQRKLKAFAHGQLQSELIPVDRIQFEEASIKHLENMIQRAIDGQYPFHPLATIKRDVVKGILPDYLVDNKDKYSQFIL